MNHGKLDVVKQEMVRVNTDILGTSELQRTEIGKFDSDDHYYLLPWARIPLKKKKWSSPHSQQESEVQYLGTISKMTE